MPRETPNRNVRTISELMVSTPRTWKFCVSLHIGHQKNNITCCSAEVSIHRRPELSDKAMEPAFAWTEKEPLQEAKEKYRQRNRHSDIRPLRTHAFSWPFLACHLCSVSMNTWKLASAPLRDGIWYLWREDRWLKQGILPQVLQRGINTSLVVLVKQRCCGLCLSSPPLLINIPPKYWIISIVLVKIGCRRRKE